MWFAPPVEPCQRNPDIGLGSLLKVQCFNTSCMSLNHIPTGKRHGRIWDVNTKLATGLIHSGVALRQLNSLLSEINLPFIHQKTLSARLKEVGKEVKRVAKESTDEALHKEVKANEDKDEKLAVAVDAGWQKRGSGRSYDSLSGHCSMIGPQTGQVINYAVRSKDCRVCTTAASKNQQVREHACSKNWDGSSKAMEADMVIEMVREVQEKGHDIDAIIGDEDSTTIGRLRANVNDNIVKVSDKNHIRKLFGNSLYGLKKQHPMLTVKVIKYLQRCFDYIVAQGKGVPTQISADLEALSRHPFGDHQCCSSRWCRFMDNPSCLYKSFPSGKPLSNPNLQSSLKKILSTYAVHSSKLSSLGSTQANESFNRMVAAKAPKNVHYSSSGNLAYRVAACVAQKNTGHNYLVSVNRSLGLSPGHFTERLAKLRDSQRLKNRAIVNSHKFKRKRLGKKSKQYQKIASLEVREGTSYQPGCTLMSSNDIQEIPPPTVQPEYTPIDKDHLSQCQFAFFDLETTGLGRDSHIIQLSAVHTDGDFFNSYIKPEKKISPAASKVTGLEFENGKMFHNSRQVEHLGIKEALHKFFLFLEKFDKVILVGHNCKSFDIPILLSALQNNNLLENFMSVGVIGVIDTLPLFKECLPNLSSYSQPKVYETVFVDQYKAHDSLEDVFALCRLVEKTNPCLELKSEFSLSLSSVVAMYHFKIQAKSLYDSLNPLLQTKVISKCIALKIANSGLALSHLFLAFKRDRQQGVGDLLSEMCGNSLKVRVTKSKRIIHSIVQYFDCLEEKEC